ncbi:3-dehydroquinate synthase [Algoriphagus sp.]|uniref:3-dehydroquinate synthase n=1 Tax=Algoriphagus sp. TaxID=1872435 RepID=UPI002620EB5B|nr:3-dehydroquinate synthase [Algoriphagus sp.]
MNTILQQSFAVTFQYPVCFTEDLFDPSNSLFVDVLEKGKKNKTYFVIDQGVVQAFPALIDQIQAFQKAHQKHFFLSASPKIVPGGEACKNDPTVYQQIVQATHEFGIDRHAYIVAIGGGAVLDMVGFAAAISHRGIRLIRIPTTVLSQNDSGVGVKNSINFFGKKNYLGTFTTPVAVLNDFNFLKTLDDRDWRSGISEALKVALIKDLNFFEWLEKHQKAMATRDMEAMKTQIIRCAKMHMAHIAGKDPFEQGSSRPLDFGHWAAHKLEHLSAYRIRHGEAVAIGIALDSTYSHLLGWISKQDLMRILELIQGLGFSLYEPELSAENLLQGLREFQEHLGGQLTIMLLEQLGKGVEVHEMDDHLIQKSVSFLQEKSRKLSLR